MKLYNCVWCGCNLEYKDDVCVKHIDQLGGLRRNIYFELVRIDLNKRKINWMMFQFTQKVNKLIERELEVDKARRIIDKKATGVMSDKDQRSIFISLGIAV